MESLKIEGPFKWDFIKWASRREPFNLNKYTKTLVCFNKDFFELPVAFQLQAFCVFGDEHEFCVHIEPYLGGGQPEYFASINYRNEDHIDMQYDVDNGDENEFWTRHEATLMAVNCLVELYNKQKDILKETGLV